MRIVGRVLAILVLIVAALAAVAWWRTGVLDVTFVRPGVWMLSGIGSNVTVNSNGGTIDGATSLSIVTAYDARTVVSDGANWFVIAK